jgi:hypothetical protein
MRKLVQKKASKSQKPNLAALTAAVLATTSVAGNVAAHPVSAGGASDAQNLNTLLHQETALQDNATFVGTKRLQVSKKATKKKAKKKATKRKATKKKAKKKATKRKATKKKAKKKVTRKR